VAEIGKKSVPPERQGKTLDGWFERDETIVDDGFVWRV
jgi:hypothetical protein